MAEYKTFKELEVWIKSRAFVKEIYILTKDFPKEEVYGLSSQMRRSAVSVPSNFAEGYGRQYKKESLQFFHIARGSLYELETQLFIAADLLYLKDSKLTQMILQLDECKKLLSGLMKYFENNKHLSN